MIARLVKIKVWDRGRVLQALKTVWDLIYCGCVVSWGFYMYMNWPK